jgi:hypothetical protein
MRPKASVAPAPSQIGSAEPKAASSVVRDVPFDGGVAHIETNPNGTEHVLLQSPDGGILGESTCVAPLEGYDTVRAFFTDVRNAIVSGDVARTADFMGFPLRVNRPETRMVLTREQFLREQARIITRDVVDRVRAAEPGQVFCNWQGNPLGDGVLWAELQPNDRLRVSAINLGPGPRRRRPSQAAPGN